QSSSVRTGIEALPEDVGAAVFLLVDQPFIPPELIIRLRKTHSVNQGPIIFPEVNGERANPVLFDRKVFQDLKSITGDSGGRTLFNSHASHAVPWDDNRIQIDIDTPEDYQALRSDWE
ncbi:MAG: nucleotidyltransferase family protein, partial [Anaerolineales bacterium]|nr:nucleotidyltransferase family protein [Anaerolineales bacterium]